MRTSGQWLLLAFLLSGMSGLIYQTVWVRMLSRYLGSTTYSTAIVLSGFMGGLALGARWGAWLADRRKPSGHLRLYALLEVFVAAAGIGVSLLLIASLGDVYVHLRQSWTASSAQSLVVQLVYVLFCLLIPTTLMGATLPLLVAWASQRAVTLQTALGELYGANTAGALIGVLCTGFLLIGHFGERTCLYMAAVLNLIAAAVAIGLAQSQTSRSREEKDELAPVDRAVEEAGNRRMDVYPLWATRLAFLTLFVSGFTALAYEIIWTRLLIIFLETSIYSFTVMLALFLAGIAWGSDWTAKRQVGSRDPLSAFGILEIAIGAWASVMLLVFPFFGSQQLPFSGGIVSGTVVAAIFILPIAFLFGLQFPVAVQCCRSSQQSAGGVTGRAYFLNAIGTIFGALLTGFLFIPSWGPSMTMAILAVVNIVLGTVLIAASRRLPASHNKSRIPVAWAGIACLLPLAALIAGNPYYRVMHSRLLQRHGEDAEIFAWHEGAAGTTIAAGSRSDPMDRSLLINGVGMTHLTSEAKVMAHLPYALATDPQQMLIICFGMGTTCRSAATYPELMIDVVDIIPEVFDTYTAFHPDGRAILARENVRPHVEDGRNFLLLSSIKYDVITVDPAPPIHSAGTVNLYTREFFEQCRTHLSSGGVFCLWVPPGPTSELQLIMRTFFHVFPDATVWGGTEFPGFFLIGGREKTQLGEDRLELLYAQLAKIDDLGEWDASFQNPDRLRRMYLGDAHLMSEFIGEGPIITDDLPLTEFPLFRNLLNSDRKWPLTADVVRDWLASRTTTSQTQPSSDRP